MEQPPHSPDPEWLLEVAERPRAGGWSLRAALVRYAQPQPVRASSILEVVRRIDFALRPRERELADPDPDDSVLAGLVRAVLVLDQLADRLAAWASGAGDVPSDDHVDEVTSRLGAHLDALGVGRERHEEWTGRRGRG